MEVATLRLLGPFELTGMHLAPKERAVLALLALRCGEPVSRDRLVAELWGDDAPRSALGALQVYVSHVRRALGESAVATHGDSYVLTIESDRIDSVRFERLAAAAREALDRGEPAAAVRRAEHALELWHGPALADIAAVPALEAESARLEELRLLTEEVAVDGALQLGRHEELVPELEALVSAEPLREHRRSQLMLALYRCGRQAEALAVYRDCRAALIESLGIEPGRQLRELEQAILRQDPELELRLPDRGPRPLPAPATPLVGRGAELAAALDTLDGGARLLTLTGPGGIGKTRLAVELARLLAGEFVDGVALVPLDRLSDASRVESAIAVALALAADQPLAGQVADSSVLLVLDNFEHLVSAAPVVADLLATAPHLVIVVTSRSPLHLAAEHVLPVPPLESEEAAALFVVRALAAAAALSAAEHGDTIDEICARLEGLPLAIELAAAQARLLPPKALLERLENRLAVLGTGPRDAPARQRTMSEAIAWSFDLLTPEAQRLLTRLSVFAGGIAVEAAAAVGESDERNVLDGIAALVDQSLLQPQPGGDRARFHLLEVVREFGLERLRAAGDEAAVRRLHLGYFAQLAQRAGAAFETAEERRWFAVVETEHDNLRGALRFAIDEGRGLDALQMASALAYFWRVRGLVREGSQWLLLALDAAADDAPASLIARAWNAVGIFAAERGDLDGAAVALRKALDVARAAGDDERVASALNNLGGIELLRGDYGTARRLLEETLDSRDTMQARAAVLENLAMASLGENDVPRALELGAAAAEEAHAAGKFREEGSALRLIARAHLTAGAVEAAQQALSPAIELAVAIDDRHGIMIAVEIAAALAAAAGDHEAAATLLGAIAAARAEAAIPRPGDHDAWLKRTLGSAAAAGVNGPALSLDDAVARARSLVAL